MQFIKKIFFKKSPLVNIIRMHGVIASASRFPGSSNISLESLEKPLARAFSGKRVAGVALIINSPGGSPVQCALISERIIQLSKKHDVPVYSFIEDIAASGGYWLACSADKIYVMPSSILGSIGVISAGFGFVEIIKKLGIERRVYSKGKNKGMLDPFQPENTDDVAIITDMQDEIHKQFKEWVILRRGKKIKKPDIEKEGIFEAKIFSGSRACELGLADSIGELRTILKERIGDDVVFREVTGRKKLTQRLGLSSSIYNKLIEDIEERIAFARFGL